MSTETVTAGIPAQAGSPENLETRATASSGIPAAARGLDVLGDVELQITVELGRTRRSIRELLALTPGAVLELDRAAGSPVDLLVNGRLLAHGEVVVVDEQFGVRITEIVGLDGAL